MIIKLIAKLITVMNSNTRPFQIGAGIAFGLLLALLPSSNLFFAVAVLLVFLLRVHLAMTIFSALVLSLVVPAFDPLLNRLGIWFLSLPSLQGFFVAAYETPVVALTRFYDALVAGSLLAGVVLWAPVSFLSMGLVHLYRKYVHPRIVNSKLVKAIMATPLAQKLSRAVRSVQAVWPSVG